MTATKPAAVRAMAKINRQSSGSNHTPPLTFHYNIAWSLWRLKIQTKRVSPHVLRHTMAMSLLQDGVDRSAIALWLGHESMDTTQIYLHASLELKEQALAKTKPINCFFATLPPSRQTARLPPGPLIILSRK